MKKFKQIREQALTRWVVGKRWEIENSNEILKFNWSNSVECNIQNHELTGNKHINFMCSMNDYCMHIFDLLTDARYDEYELSNEDTKKEELKNTDAFLFRQYNRLYMFGHETLEVLVKLYMFGTKVNDKSNTRKKLSWPYEAGKMDTVDIISRYVNKIVKHNLDGFHKCNNHIPVYFQDGEGKINKTKKLIKASNLTDEQFKKGDVNGIVVPNLIGLIECLLYAYNKIEELFNDKNNLLRLIDRYGE